MGLLVGCKGEAGVSLGEAGLEGIFAGGEIGDRKVTTEVVGRSKPEGVRVGNRLLDRRGLKNNRHKGEDRV